MEVLTTNEGVRRRVEATRQAGSTLALVPTMGYLHAGHMRLVDAARRDYDRVAVSIFVNPTQFGPHEDFARYPRDLERDAALCREHGVDWIYAPAVDELYPHGPGTLVVPPEAITNTLCGTYRPGHFTGVATVVAKLLALWQPDAALFGQKDFQQTVVIRRLVADLCLPVKVVTVPTEREPDGLAMSSRNVYLTGEERARALALSRALQAGWEAARVPGAGPDDVRRAAEAVLADATAVSLQYLELVDAQSLAPAETLDRPAVLAVAAHLGKTRLIDNVALDGPAPLPPHRREASS